MSDAYQAALLERAKREQAKRAADSSKTTTLEQFGSGVNEGLANMIGAPVDLMTTAVNAGISGVNKLAGTEISPIQDPVGGSGTFKDVLSPVISEDAPETSLQRYARRGGQEIGAMAIPGGVAMRGAAKPARLLAAETLSAGGAAIGGQTAREIAPESAALDTLMSLMGGVTPLSLTRSGRQKPKAPSLDELRAGQASAYKRVQDSGAELSPSASQDLADRLTARIADEGVPEFLPPAVRGTASKVEALPQGATIMDVEQLRRRVGSDLAGSSDAQSRRIGVDLKKEIDDYLKNLEPNQLASGTPDNVLSDLQEGRDLTSRIKKTEELFGETGAVTRATRRASTSGVGGNELNAIRQNIRSILDSPRKRRAYSADELKAMEELVAGTPSINAARLLGRLSPDANGLSLLALGAGGATFGPAGTVPSLMGYMAKAGAEGATHKQLSALGELVRNGAPLPKAPRPEAMQRGLLALLASQGN